MRKKILALLLSSIAFSNVFAVEWTYVGTTTDSKTLFAYERDGIRKTSEGLLVWVAEINSNPQLPYDLMLEIYTFDCDKLKYRTEQTTFYLKGKVKHQMESDYKWVFATPGSIGEAMVDGACNRYPSKFTFKNNDWNDLTRWGKNLLKRVKSASETSF